MKNLGISYSIHKKIRTTSYHPYLNAISLIERIMMYFPYMRGKQFELAALKEVAPRLNSTKVSPVIEPINDNIDRLCTTIEVLNNHNIVPHVIVNPQVGDLASDSPDFLNIELSKHTVSFIPCIRLHNQNILYIKTLLQQLINDSVPFSLYLQEDIQSNITPYTSNSVANIIQNLNRYCTLSETHYHVA